MDSRPAGADKRARMCKFKIDQLLQWNGIRLIRIRANRQCIGFLQSTPELSRTRCEVVLHIAANAVN